MKLEIGTDSVVKETRTKMLIKSGEWPKEQKQEE